MEEHTHSPALTSRVRRVTLTNAIEFSDAEIKAGSIVSALTGVKVKYSSVKWSKMDLDVLQMARLLIFNAAMRLVLTSSVQWVKAPRSIAALFLVSSVLCSISSAVPDSRQEVHSHVVDSPAGLEGSAQTARLMDAPADILAQGTTMNSLVTSHAMTATSVS